MNEQIIKSHVSNAIEALIKESPSLNFQHVCERSTAHRLAVHMETLFSDYNIDCEYNRDDQDNKLLEGIAAHRTTKNPTDSVFPDIIVHKRGQTGSSANLLVVELKRNSDRDEIDFKKLELFTKNSGHYGYKLGLYININDGAFNRVWFKNGKKDGAN